jgi:hypothetical protein
MKNLFTILLGLTLLVGCQPAGNSGGGGTEGGSDDTSSNTTAVENESSVPVSVVKFSVPGMT